MSGISSLSGYSSVAQYTTSTSDSSKLQQKLLEKIDSNGDGSIDKSELKSFLDYVDSSTGSTSDVDSTFSSLDSNGDGSVSSDELSANADTLIDQLRDQLRSAQLSGSAPTSGGPPPGPPPDDSDSDDLFAAIDTDSNGSIDESELSAFFSQNTGETSEESPMEGMLASLIEQYTAVSTGTSSTSASSSLSAVA